MLPHGETVKPLTFSQRCPSTSSTFNAEILPRTSLRGSEHTGKVCRFNSVFKVSVHWPISNIHLTAFMKNKLYTSKLTVTYLSKVCQTKWQHSKIHICYITYCKTQLNTEISIH